MNSRLFVLISMAVVLACIVLLSACVPSGGEAGPQIYAVPAGSEKRFISEEKIDLDNCSGTSEKGQTVEHSFSVLHTAELGTSVTIGADGVAGIPGIGNVSIGASIASQYNVGYGTQEAIARTAFVSAAAGSHIVHTIQHNEIWEKGEIVVVSGDNDFRAPYSFRRDFTLDQGASANIGCPLPGAPVATEKPPNLPEVVTPITLEPEAESLSSPLREHFEVIVGTGIFEKGTFSDGDEPLTEQALWDSGSFDIQRIRRQEYPNGCDVSRYDTDLIWVAGTPGMRLLINGQEVGQYTIAPNAHGYIFNWPIRMGDEICAVDVGPEGFQFVLGPDIYYQYDSYCYRGAC